MQGIYQVIDSSVIGGSDIQVNSQGDYKLARGSEYIVQRILRRLMTVPGSYIQHPDYGAGLPLYVGQPLSNDLSQKIKTSITTQMLLEDEVSRNPEPVTILKSQAYFTYAQVTFKISNQEQPVILTFNFEK